MNLNDFIISEELGAGKYGHVYIAKYLDIYLDIKNQEWSSRLKK